MKLPVPCYIIVTEESIIPVENINGAILLLSSINDSVWSSFESSNYIERRLNKSHFPFSYKHIAFQHISHIMTTEISSVMQMLFKSERKDREQCKLERKRLKNELINWIENEWHYQMCEVSKADETEESLDEKNERKIPKVSKAKILKKENDNSLER